eukprot:CAMPEP_0171985696 /NCGR_PEP_ID=MMETSP0993-20121228/274487_1 /TAXON_ID=483369 /ORGANISM="non described non described, Strain CCMP2098" /LENGTH=254 /DNA_ID=CAMNT_0012638575 /DNA_START=63 /DNA_END=827 /DNA_ORIENTATION=+
MTILPFFLSYVTVLSTVEGFCAQPSRSYVGRGAAEFNPVASRRLAAEVGGDKMPAQLPNQLWSLPNKLSASRIAMIPILGLLWDIPHLRAGVFVAASLTDFLDGYLARKMKTSSRFGAFLDPVADKLMVATALVLLSGEWGMVVAAPAALILCREIGVSALREWMAEQQQRDVVKVSWAGKLKTVTQLIAISILLTTRPSSLLGPTADSHMSIYSAAAAKAGLISLYVATAATIFSGWNYLRAAWPVLSRTDGN